jgi:outer membrane beta-barrel protein
MSHRNLLVAVLTSLIALPVAAFAQEPEIEIEPESQPATSPEVEVDPNAAVPEPDIGSEAAEAKGKTAKDEIVKKGEGKASWKDVVVIIRKPFLKANRIELVPTFGITLNDNMIRHYQFEAEASYHLSDALSVGVEAAYYVKDLLTPYELVATTYRRLPTLNQYNFSAALNFHYVPIYAKFAMMNKWIVHWEAVVTAGVGVLQTEVLPRDPADLGWTNLNISPNVGIGLRVFITNGLALNLGVKDYIFSDRFENVNRGQQAIPPGESELDIAKDNATSKLINHIVFQIGLSFWIPPTFNYTTFR